MPRAAVQTLLSIAREKEIGIINGLPFGSALLSVRGPADWHPASATDRAVFRRAAEFAAAQGVPIEKLAIQFASSNPSIPTTLFSSANPDSVVRNVRWHEEASDGALIARVREILEPVRDKHWDY